MSGRPTAVLGRPLGGATAAVVPTASAGANQSQSTLTAFSLTGSGTGTGTLTYAWTFESVPLGSARVNGDITGATTVNGGFTPDRPGDYVLIFTVTDADLKVARDSVRCRVTGSRVTYVDLTDGSWTHVNNSVLAAGPGKSGDLVTATVKAGQAKTLEGATKNADYWHKTLTDIDGADVDPDSAYLLEVWVDMEGFPAQANSDVFVQIGIADDAVLTKYVCAGIINDFSSNGEIRLTDDGGAAEGPNSGSMRSMRAIFDNSPAGSIISMSGSDNDGGTSTRTAATSLSAQTTLKLFVAMGTKTSVGTSPTNDNAITAKIAYRFAQAPATGWNP